MRILKMQNRQTKRDYSPSRRGRYRLSSIGLDSLRASIARVRPWQFACGPVTVEGKAQSSRNAWKHGLRSARAIQQQREDAQLMRLIRNLGAKQADRIEL